MILSEDGQLLNTGFISIRSMAYQDMANISLLLFHLTFVQQTSAFELVATNSSAKSIESETIRKDVNTYTEFNLERSTVLECSKTKTVCMPGWYGCNYTYDEYGYRLDDGFTFVYVCGTTFNGCYEETRKCYIDKTCKAVVEYNGTCGNPLYMALCKNRFSCGDGRCIDPTSICDGEADCDNGIDEQKCLKDCSEITSFDCTNGECVHYNFICDGVQHCSNGFDEEGCDLDVMQHCKSDRYAAYFRLKERKLNQKSCFSLTEQNECKRRNGQLLTIANARMHYSASQYLENVFLDAKDIKIKIGLRLLSSNKRYNDYIWADGSPLTYTPGWEYLNSTDQSYKCFAMILVNNITRWDYIKCGSNYIDSLCFWKSSDNDVTSIVGDVMAAVVAITGLTNPLMEFRCDSGEIIAVVYVCDHVSDCHDNSDELYCDTDFSKDVHTCDDGTTINIGLWCDHYPDCPDRSDEINCRSVPPSCDEEYGWRCDNGQCVPLIALCDKTFDCADRSDERLIHCLGRCEERNLYSCGDSDQCIPWSLSVDDVRDCKNGADRIESVVPVCSQNNRPTFIDAGNDMFGPIKAECDGDGIKIWTIGFVVSADLENNKTIITLRFGSEFMLNEVIDQYYDCSQRIFSNKLYPKSRTKTYSIGSTGSYILIKGDLPIRVFVADGQDYYGNAVTDIGCEDQKLNRRDDLLALRKTRCKTEGMYTYEKNMCLLNTKPDGAPVGCRDLTQLDNCAEFRCPSDYVKCPGSYCLHVRLVCDGHAHCPHGEDELGCEQYNCKGMYKCRKSSSCLPYSLVCDQIRQCPFGDDELFCSSACPSSCSCRGATVSCKSDINTDNVFVMAKYVRYLEITDTILSYQTYNQLSQFVLLVVLNLTRSGIQELSTNVSQNLFLTLNNLRILDLSDNHFELITNKSFKGLHNLRTLILDRNNYLTSIEKGAFDDLKRLTDLIIANTGILNIHGDLLIGLSMLKRLDLRNNLMQLKSGLFKFNTRLSYLDVRGTSIEIDRMVFDGITSLETLYTDSPALCCLLKEMFYTSLCVAPKTYISSCEDLIENDLLRLGIWIIGGLALLGNVFVVVYRLKHDLRRHKWKSHTAFVTALGFSDLIMGIYIIIIAAVDVNFRNVYTQHDQEWRTSSLCTFAGILSTISNEASAMLICLISIDRYIAIKFPFSKLNVKLSMMLASICGVLSIVIAILPVVLDGYFGGEFYSRSAVCASLPLTPDRPKGWQYSIGIFIVLNMAIFIITGIAYLLLHKEVKASSNIKTNQKSRDVDIAVAKSLAMIIVTDFCCWFPVCVLGFVSLAGHQISHDMYAWVVVFVLPINSALNPFLYTVSSIRKKTRRSGQTVLSTMDTTMANTCLQILHKISRDQRSLIRPRASMSLSRFVSEYAISTANVLSIKRGIEKELEFYHGKNFYHGHIAEDTVSVVVEDTEVVDVFLEFQHTRVTALMDRNKDIDCVDELMKRLRHSVKRQQQCQEDENQENIDIASNQKPDFRS